MEEGTFLLILEFYCHVRNFLRRSRAQMAVEQIAVKYQVCFNYLAQLE